MGFFSILLFFFIFPKLNYNSQSTPKEESVLKHTGFFFFMFR